VRRGARHPPKWFHRTRGDQSDIFSARDRQTTYNPCNLENQAAISKKREPRPKTKILKKITSVIETLISCPDLRIPVETDLEPILSSESLLNNSKLWTLFRV
jgi:hypothetical protein